MHQKFLQMITEVVLNCYQLDSAIPKLYGARSAVIAKHISNLFGDFITTDRNSDSYCLDKIAKALTSDAFRKDMLKELDAEYKTEFSVDFEFYRKRGELPIIAHSGLDWIEADDLEVTLNDYISDELCSALSDAEKILTEGYLHQGELPELSVVVEKGNVRDEDLCQTFSDAKKILSSDQHIQIRGVNCKKLEDVLNSIKQTNTYTGTFANLVSECTVKSFEGKQLSNGDKIKLKFFLDLLNKNLVLHFSFSNKLFSTKDIARSLQQPELAEKLDELILEKVKGYIQEFWDKTNYIVYEYGEHPDIVDEGVNEDELANLYRILDCLELVYVIM